MATSGSNGNVQLGSVGGTVKLAAAAVGAIGVVLAACLLIFGAIHPDRFFRAYIAVFMTILAISLGGLIFTMIQHATRAGWSVVVRRIFEVLASNLIWIWVLFIPIAVAMVMSAKTHLFEWNIASVVEHDAVLQGKQSYLNAQFWLIRAAIFFGLWALLSRFFLANSVAQDLDGRVEHTHRMERLAPVGILLFAATSSLAAVDWMMSLSPHWFSTMFGVYFFAASSAAFLSTLILVVYFLQRSGKLTSQVTAEHYQDMGKLLFAFGVVFWAYIAFSQFMLIWYANLPEETGWFLFRGQGGWYGVSFFLLLGHFIIPFVLIMSKHPKRRRPIIAAAAGWMLFMAFVDFYWMSVPQIPGELLTAMQADVTMGYSALVDIMQNGVVPAEILAARGYDASETVTYEDLYGFNPHLADIALLLGLGGIYLAATIHRLGRQSLITLQDPRLGESLAFENM